MAVRGFTIGPQAQSTVRAPAPLAVSVILSGSRHADGFSQTMVVESLVRIRTM
jgi:hypothetical protein